MNRKQILEASDTQLNIWCATEVMGWAADGEYYVKAEDPAWIMKDKPTYDAEGSPSSPLGNITESIALLDWLRKEGEADWAVRGMAQTFYECRVFLDWGEVSYLSEDLPRAIVVAVLLASRAIREKKAASE